MEKEIPIEVKKLYDSTYTIEYLGKYKGADAYRAYIPYEKTGFPSVCLVRPKGINKVDGFDALDIIERF